MTVVWCVIRGHESIGSIGPRMSWFSVQLDLNAAWPSLPQELLKFDKTPGTPHKNPKNKRCNTSTHPKIAQISFFFWVTHFYQWQCLVNCQTQGSNVPMRLSMARCFSFTWWIHSTTMLENVQSYVGVFTDSATDLPCQIHRQWASESHHSSWAAHSSFNQFSKIPSEEDVKGIDVKWSC